MSKEYKIDKEYSVWEIIQYNLRKWWLMLIMAVLCAAALGGYKYMYTKDYVENTIYQDKQQVVATLFVTNYNETSVVERAGNVTKIAKSNRAYDAFVKETKMDITMDDYTQLFEMQQTDASGVVSLYVTFPANTGSAAITDEQVAMQFAEGVIKATIATCEEIIGAEGVSVLDAPYVTQEVVVIESYSITEEEFKQGVLKAAAAGALLGILVEVVLYTCWMLLCKKPKNTEEVRQCLDSNIIDVLKEGEDDENGFKKVALYLADEEASCNKVNCIRLQCPKNDVALKLAMSYANEQKKTLYIDLTVNENTEEKTNSISKYIIGESDEVKPLVMSDYLDAVCRNRAEESGMDVVGNKRFAEFISDMEKKYECIVIGNTDVTQSAEAYAVAKFCNKSFVVCSRKNARNEELYRAKNILAVNEIEVDGVLVYEL